MDSIQRIPKFKPKLQYFGLTFIVAMLFSLLLNPITAYASDFDTALNNARDAWVNSTSGNMNGGTSTIANGVSKDRTGYLCYLLTPDGNTVPGTGAVALKSTTMADYAGSEWQCTSRKGGYSASSWYADGTIAPWNTTPWIISDDQAISKEPEIKAWMAQKTLSTERANGIQFVGLIWGDAAMDKFIANEYILVIETIMNFQYSKANADGSTQPVTLTPEQQAELQEIASSSAFAIIITMDRESLISEASGTQGYSESVIQDMTDADLRAIVLNKWSSTIYHTLANETTSTESSGGRIYFGPPYIGTVPVLTTLNVSSTTVFDSYLKGTAPHAEKIARDDAGFIAWTGGEVRLTYEQVRQYGVAMMIIHSTDLVEGQTTCDEPQQPAPHDPPNESTGNCTIIKSYRTKNSDGTLQHVSNHYLPGVSNNITIEEESIYKVIGWKASTNPRDYESINSAVWDSEIPPMIGDTGTSPTVVTLPESHRYLYILLEKPDTTPPPIDANYELTQSTIARHINLNTPDQPTVNGTTMEKLGDHEFKWTLPDITDPTCPGHPYNYDYCDDEHSADCDDVGCTTPNCTESHTEWDWNRYRHYDFEGFYENVIKDFAAMDFRDREVSVYYLEYEGRIFLPAADAEFDCISAMSEVEFSLLISVGLLYELKGNVKENFLRMINSEPDYNKPIPHWFLKLSEEGEANIDHWIR